MYNDDVNMILESAYADGYYQAMTDIDKGYYDAANEATALKKGLVGILGGPLGSLIGNIIHNSRVNKSVVLSLADCVGIYGSTDGDKKYKHAFNLFAKQGFLANTTFKEEVKFSDLTPEGKKFMHGYYSAIDEIKSFDLKKAKASSNINKEALTNSGVTGAKLVVGIANAISQTSAMKAAMAPVGAIAAVGAAGCIPALVLATFNIVDAVKSMKDHKAFKKTMQNMQETQESAGYNNFINSLLFDDSDLFDDMD